MRGLEDDDAKRPGLAGTAYQHRGIRDKRELRLIGERRITFDLRHHFSYVAGHGTCALPGPMRLSLSAFDPGATLLLQRSYTRPEMDLLARACDTLRSQVEARSQLPATC